MRSLGAFAAFLLVGAGLALPVVAESRPRDHDRDGLTNKRERLRLHTNPRKADTDEDRLRDRFELRRSHTNPRRADTDRDRLRDGREWLVLHTNPRKADTDGDGLGDGFEALTSGTEPRTVDTDRDGNADGVELLMGTDPLEKPRKRRLIDPAPDTSIVSGPSGTVPSSSASFGFSSSEAGSTFRCRLDRGTWVACDSPRGYAGLANGSHTFDVQAVDAAGNLDSSPASRKWTVDVPPPDTSAPDTSLGSGPSGTVASNAASFSFWSSEAGTSFQCRLDGAAWTGCGSPKEYSGLANGSHTFDVRATDAAGNTDASPASRTWTVNVPPPDTTAPETSISAGPSGTVASASASFSFSSSEAGSSFQCRLDAGAWASCSSPKAYSGLANGSHTFDVRATDAAGNTDASPASRTWTVNVPPPPPGSANVYLSPSGSDSAACSQAAPCQSMARGYAVAAAGQVVQLAAGTYPRQDVPAGTKAVTFRGGPGVSVRQLMSNASNATYDGIEVDAGGLHTTGAALEIHGSGTTFKNAAVGNVVDEKGLLVVGANHTVDNVVFHDAILRTNGVHMECVYAIGVPGFTIRNSTFRDCAVMDLFFTYGSWWTPQPPSYGNVTIENNVFSHPEMESNGGWHYYSLYINPVGPAGAADPLDGWVVRHNTFERTASIVPQQGTNGTRWVGNLGDWDCRAGISYTYNVGKKCSATDKQVSPASSSQTATAPLGWVNPGTLDFHLTASSPALNAGDPADHPATDRDGVPRDSTPDAGAYEYR
jgi:Bacterial TSP3 repeat